MKKRWYLMLPGAVVVLATLGMLSRTQDEAHDLYVNAKRGPFEVTVTATGELKAKNSVKIYGPSSTRQLGIYQMKIMSLVLEGTVVEKGAVVAELDRSELTTKISEAALNADFGENYHGFRSKITTHSERSDAGCLIIVKW